MNIIYLFAIIFKCMSILPAYMSLHLMEVRKMYLIPWDWSYRLMLTAVWVSRVSPGSSGRALGALYHWANSPGPPPYFWDNLSLNLELNILVRLANQWNPSIYPSPPLALRLCVSLHTQLLCGYWRPELSFACWQQALYRLNILPQLGYFLCTAFSSLRASVWAAYLLQALSVVLEVQKVQGRGRGDNSVGKMLACKPRGSEFASLASL